MKHRLVAFEVRPLATRKFMLHVCPFDAEDRYYGAPWRAHLNTPWFHFAFALRPKDTFAGRIDMVAWREHREVVTVEKPAWAWLRVAPRTHNVRTTG